MQSEIGPLVVVIPRFDVTLFAFCVGELHDWPNEQHMFGPISPQFAMDFCLRPYCPEGFQAYAKFPPAFMENPLALWTQYFLGHLLNSH